jgi:hypothetical protein
MSAIDLLDDALPAPSPLTAVRQELERLAAEAGERCTRLTGEFERMTTEAAAGAIGLQNHAEWNRQAGRQDAFNRAAALVGEAS